MTWIFWGLGIGRSIFDFFKTPLGQIVGVALLVAAAFVYGGHLEGKAVRAEWATANVKADLAKKKREQEVQSRVDELERTKTAALETQQDEFRKKLEQYETELKKRPDARCTLGSDDIKRLRSLVR
jgi:hypothetical protein